MTVSANEIKKIHFIDSSHVSLMQTLTANNILTLEGANIDFEMLANSEVPMCENPICSPISVSLVFVIAD